MDFLKTVYKSMCLVRYLKPEHLNEVYVPKDNIMFYREKNRKTYFGAI